MKEKGDEEDIKEWKDSFGDTVLMEVTRFGRENVLRWLLHELKVDYNEQDSYGNTELHCAAYYNRMECARLLLDVGSQHLKNRWGETPLYDAKELKNDKDMTELLKSHFQLR